MSRHNVPDLTDFYDTIAPVDAQPEKRLLVAMVQRALMDYLHPKTTQRLHNDASAWIFNISTEPYSLLWICGYLSDDPRWLLQRIQFVARTGTPVKRTIVRVDSR